jgi:hypothetical protein
MPHLLRASAHPEARDVLDGKAVGERSAGSIPQTLATGRCF